MTDLVAEFGYHSSANLFLLVMQTKHGYFDMIGKGEGNTGAV
jgi:hypothetical protein